MIDKRLEKTRTFYKHFKRLPTYSEMLEMFRLSSKNAIFKIVQKWLHKGIVVKISDKLTPTQKFFSLPLVGQVKAGFPTISDEENNFLSIDDYLIDNPAASFMVKVDGDSLSGLGIMPGDLAIIEKRTDAKNGEIILARIDREWTMKILKKEQGKVYLESANSKYPRFSPHEELEIMGVITGVIRKYR